MLGHAQRQADGGRRNAVVGDIVAIDAQRSLAELAADADATLGDVRKHQNTLGTCHQIFVLRTDS